jgi:hypothetical protein
MIKIFTQDKDGKHLIATVETINQVEPYRECCRNIITEDVEMERIVQDLPKLGSLEDDKLCIEMGIDPRKLESAYIMAGCIAIMPVLLLIAYFTQ